MKSAGKARAAPNTTSCSENGSLQRRLVRVNLSVTEKIELLESLSGI